MTNDELLAKLQETEWELTLTKEELAQTKSLLDSLAKQYQEGCRVTTLIATVMPEIREKLKTLTPEQMAQREDAVQTRTRKLG
jgi:hypothetical protein